MKKVTEFINVQQAEDYKAKMEKVQRALKIPFIVSIPATILFNWWINADIPDLTGILGFLLNVLAFVEIFAMLFIWVFTIIKGGKIVLSIVGKLLILGFIIIPLPYSLFTGLFVFIFGLYAILLAPCLILAAVWWKTRKEIKYADEYIYYNSAEVVDTP